MPWDDKALLVLEGVVCRALYAYRPEKGGSHITC